MRIEFTKRTKRDAFMRCHGYCERCGMRLQAGAVHYDHIIACAIGGDNDIGNCQVLCPPCHRQKTGKKDIPAIAKTKRIQDRERGIRNAPRLRSRGFDKAPPQRSASRPIIHGFD